MKVTAILIAAAAFAFGVSAQAEKPNIDTTILQYALTLEHLEANFYAGILAKYNAKAFVRAGYSVGVFQRVAELARQEAIHVATLESVLGPIATKPCTYKFPYKNLDQALALSQALESVGVSAYLGAANKITDPFYLQAAGSILTVEARHQAVISEINGDIGFPSAFDTPLGFSQVYSLASGFIVSCPESNPALPVTQFPALTASPKGICKGQLQLNFKCDKGNTPLFAHVLNGNADDVVPVSGKHTIAFPAVRGTVYIVISTSKDGLTDANTVAGPLMFEVPENFSPIVPHKHRH